MSAFSEDEKGEEASDPFEAIEEGLRDIAEGRVTDGPTALAPYLSDAELEAIDVDSAFANADLGSPSADAADLRAVTAAHEHLVHAQAELETAVRAARGNGRTWTRIAGLIGVHARLLQIEIEGSA